MLFVSPWKIAGRRHPHSGRIWPLGRDPRPVSLPAVRPSLCPLSPQPIGRLTWDGDDGNALIGHHPGRAAVLHVEMGRLETPPAGVEKGSGEQVNKLSRPRRCQPREGKHRWPTESPLIQSVLWTLGAGSAPLAWYVNKRTHGYTSLPQVLCTYCTSII